MDNLPILPTLQMSNEEMLRLKKLRLDIRAKNDHYQHLDDHDEFSLYEMINRGYQLLDEPSSLQRQMLLGLPINLLSGTGEHFEIYPVDIDNKEVRGLAYRNDGSFLFFRKPVGS